MTKNKITDILWYADSTAIDKGEPGIYHSLMRSVASTLNYIDKSLDPVWLMGSSAFAFRICVSEISCPSAMSMFSFKDLIPEIIKQAGHNCCYIDRMWDEKNKEEEKRIEAHQSIVTAIDKGIPAICWDVKDAEWGIITGYDDQKKSYHAMDYDGNEVLLPYEKLGKNCIEILSLCIPENLNLRKRNETIRNSLEAAITHAEGKEWTDDRPKYQNGLEAFNTWAAVFEKWAWINCAGKSDNIGSDLPEHTLYYAGHYYSARCYARDYLKLISNENEHLLKASLAYKEVADSLKPLWEYFSNEKKPDTMLLRSFAQDIYSAKLHEQEGLDLITKYLSETN